jgi:uncharacterized repeat protein (TIGR04138 family)
MPPSQKPTTAQSLHQLAKEAGPYPAEAYEFVQRGLSYTVQKLHGTVADPDASRHVSGRQLCEGLREFSLTQWGLLARVVLRQWEIHSTVDFGRIVFALIDAGQMQKTDDDTQMQRTDEDTLDDFSNVYDFKMAFEAGYRIQMAS